MQIERDDLLARIETTSEEEHGDVDSNERYVAPKSVGYKSRSSSLLLKAHSKEEARQ